jgi:hypothetical protein
MKHEITISFAPPPKGKGVDAWRWSCTCGASETSGRKQFAVECGADHLEKSKVVSGAAVEVA